MNKRGWLRIFEVSLAILLMFGSVFLVYRSQVSVSEEKQYIQDIQIEILSRIAEDSVLRENISREQVAPVEEFISKILPFDLKFNVTICNLSGLCAFRGVYPEKDIFVQERIISGTLEKYAPKRVKFFVWKED